MDEIQKIIASACLKHSDSGLASFDREARVILQALEDNDYKVVKVISSTPPVIKLLPSEQTDVEVLIELHKHLDICGHNINSNLKERLREIINRGNVLKPVKEAHNKQP